MWGFKLRPIAIAAILGIQAVLVAALPTSAAVTSSDVSTGASTGTVPSATAFKRRRTFNCNQNNALKNIEAKAWADAGSMAEIAAQYDSGNKWQPAMDYWMGSDSKDPNNFWKIQNVLTNQQKIHHPNLLFPEAVVDIYCGDTSPYGKVCGSRPNPVDPDDTFPSAVAGIARGLFWNTYQIVLCPRFFEDFAPLDYLLDHLSKEDGGWDKSLATRYDWSWGHTIYHELSHLNPIIAGFQALDPVYHDCPAAKLANQNGGSPSKDGGDWTPPGWNETENGIANTLISADNYAWFASGVYFQNALKLSKPAEAYNDCGIFRGSTSSSVEVTRNSTFSVFIDLGNRVDGTYGLKEPPETPAENTPPDDPPTPNLPYTPGPLPSDLALPLSKGEASAYFATYTPTLPASTIPSATPTSGSVTSISANPPKASESVMCNASYKVVLDQFTVEGKAFPADKLDKNGVHGDGLKQHIQGCGALTDWNFQTLTDDPNGMEWKATGHLPIGTIACVGRAVESAGGNSKDKCTSAG